MPREATVLRRRALRLDQHPKYPLYLFALTAKELLAIADVSRISRDDAGKLLGYQRPEVKRHITNIVEYLDSGQVLFPNSIILALSSGVDFKQVRGPKVDDGLIQAGTLEIPLPRGNQAKPAWIVDGQQRAVALSRSKHPGFVVPVNGFLADDVEVQRDQFLRINSAKPLPRGLITELLPEVTTVLPTHLAARKIPSALCDLLNKHPSSPFRGLIKRPSAAKGDASQAIASDTAIVGMLQESLSNPSGCLFPHRNLATAELDAPTVTLIVCTYWTAVCETFPEAWGLPPHKSRLMHGAGLRAMGRLMDRIMGSVNPTDPQAVKMVKSELAGIVEHCRWTSGVWEELGGLKWNDIQNTSQHVRLLSNHLVRLYVRARGSGR
jgi:DGQHR domain-containing protein